MIVIGLTGGIATGKSTVSQLLSNKYKLPVIDADLIARQVVANGTPCLARIVETFGPSVLFPDGSLDRKKLGSIIFNDPAKRKQLNAIVHPAVRRAIAKALFMLWMRGEKISILDVPLLIEEGMWKWVAKVIVVYCSAEVQLQRLMKRDSSTREDAAARLSSQMPIAQKVAYADVVIDNSGSFQDLEENVDAFVRDLRRRMAGWRALWSKVCWLVPPVGLLAALWTLAWRALARSIGRKRAARNASPGRKIA